MLINKRKHDLLYDCFRREERGDKSIVLLNEKSPIYKDIKAILFKLQEDIPFEISYEILEKACNALADTDASEFEKEDFYPEDLADDTASVYTATQLEYLSPYNEDEISDIVHDTGVKSIGNACAIWYEYKVRDAILLVLEWLEEEDK